MEKNLLCKMGVHDWETVDILYDYEESYYKSVCLRCGKIVDEIADFKARQAEQKKREEKAQKMAKGK